MKNIKSKLFGFVAAVVVALSLPATGHSQILYNGYFNIDWQYNWPLGDSYADKSSGWGMNFEGGYYFPSNVGLGAFIAFHTNNKYIPRQTFPIGGTGAITTDQQHSVFQLPFGVTGRYRFTQGRVLEPYVAVKVPVFSFEKLTDANSYLSPEMKSTGEVLGIGKDMASRINLLNGQADAARTGVESKMRTYIALYAADDDSLTASVEDYRYYLDELASLTQLAAVAATDAEYRRCLEQLLRSFLTIKRAIDTDASDIHDQLDRINAMLKGQQFGPKHGSLSLHADVRRPERTFWAQLIRVIGTLNDWKSADVNDSDASRKAFAACAPMVGLLRAELAQVKDANGVKSYGARNLDPRCRSSFYAIVHHADGPDERITSTGGRSGGALQELTSFVYGAALIYLLGGGLTSEPSYTTLFLDAALIKADGRYTQRALTVLPRLGFQVIVSAPESKTGEILEVSTKAYVTYKDPDTGLTSLREAVLHQNDMDDESSSDILKDDGVAE